MCEQRGEDKKVSRGREKDNQSRNRGKRTVGKEEEKEKSEKAGEC